MDQWLEGLHGTFLGLLPVYDGCVAWSTCGTPRTGSGACPQCFGWILDTCSNVGLSCPVLIQGDELTPTST